MNMIDTQTNKETSATRAAYLNVRDMILTGELPAGQKIKIDDLRRKLDTGASPVREALSLLTSDMLVERIDQRGFRAAPTSTANFAEILQLRCALEDIALRQSIAQASPDWEEKLVLAHHHMSRATGTDQFEDAHKTFHRILISNAASPIMQRYCAQLYDLNIRYRNLAASQANYQNRDIPAEHKQIFDAAIAGDADAASAALLSHYRLTSAYLAKHLTDL